MFPRKSAGSSNAYEPKSNDERGRTNGTQRTERNMAKVGESIRTGEPIERGDATPAETGRHSKEPETTQAEPNFSDSVWYVLHCPGGIPLDHQADRGLGHLERSGCAGVWNRLHPHGGVGVLFSESH